MLIGLAKTALSREFYGALGGHHRLRTGKRFFTNPLETLASISAFSALNR